MVKHTSTLTLSLLSLCLCPLSLSLSLPGMGSVENMAGLAGIAAVGWAAQDGSGVLSPFEFVLRDVRPDDVLIKVLYCGICHTDLHQLRNDYGFSRYPMVPGHEVTGVVDKVGHNVEKFKEGDNVGVGCIVGSCTSCDACKQEMEQYCNERKWTYNDVFYDNLPTYGGFANKMVVDQRFIVKIPPKLPLDVAAPLICAGLTVYSPMMFFGMIESGKKCGVVGLGGVGHVAVKFAKAFGLHVTVISSSPHKEEEALGVLGADSFLISSNEERMKEAQQSIDYIIDTIPATHPLDPYLSLLKMNGKLVIIGVPPSPLQFTPPSLLLGRRSIGGSFIGSMKECQDMLEFAEKNNVECMIEKIPISYVNKAIERLDKNDVRYRFVVDIANSLPNSNGTEL